MISSRRAGVSMAVAGALALVLSGGGSKGAFQVGFMEELILNRGVDIGIFGGVSTGSIQAGAGPRETPAGRSVAAVAHPAHADIIAIAANRRRQR